MEQMNAEVPALQVGDWLDVIDGDGIWNVAQVLQLPTPETVIITYDCWGDVYNEELRRDSDRIAPYHTHTWAVKCWAKLATWPWWPALLTIRVPGTSMGAQNLRLEENLLVDFLDKAEFPKRFRCWVKKSNIVAYQSDKVTRIRQKKFKMRGYQGEARSKNLAFAMKLLTTCGGQEQFPEFVQGTLPVQFEDKVTTPIEQVRREIGQEKWMQSFAENRLRHAATHGYTPVIAGSDKGEECNRVELLTIVEKAGDTSTEERTTDTSVEGAPDMSQIQEKQCSSVLDAEIENTVSIDEKATDAPNSLEKNKATTQGDKLGIKRARSDADDDISDSTDSSFVGNATLPRTQTQQECTKQSQGPISFHGKDREEKRDENVSKPNTVTKELRIEPRRYGKTPKKLKTARKSASKLPPYSPPYVRLLPRVEPRDKEYTASSSHARPATQPRPRVENGPQTGVPNKVLSASDQHVQQPNAAVRRVLACELKPSDGSVSPMESRAPLANTTLRADEKLPIMKTGLSGKLAEPTEMAAKAEEIRNKCAALPIRVNSRTSGSQQKGRGDSQVCSLTPDVASETQGVTQEALPLRSSSYDSLEASEVPTFARRSSQPAYATGRLELALDDIISKQQGQNLSAATTPAELDAIKAELLRSPEVQAAINRMKHPSYRWVAPTGVSYRARSSLSNGNFGCPLEEVKRPRYSTKHLSVTGQSARRPSQRSSSQQLGRSWRYNRKSEASSEVPQDSSLCSVFPGPPPADHSTFGFSVNDNFSMNQWYRDLYPKSFGFQ